MCDILKSDRLHYSSEGNQRSDRLHYSSEGNQRSRQGAHKRNIEVHSRSHFCRGKAISNTNSKNAGTKEDLAMTDSVREFARGYILPEARNQEQKSTSLLLLLL